MATTRETDRAWAERMVRRYKRHRYQGDRPSRIWIDTSLGRISVPNRLRDDPEALTDYLTAARRRARRELSS